MARGRKHKGFMVKGADHETKSTRKRAAREGRGRKRAGRK